MQVLIRKCEQDNEFFGETVFEFTKEPDRREEDGEPT